jgi:signal transduction histidine kinase
MPRLHEFIRQHTEEILAEWETFARSLQIAESMDVKALRDHAKEMLEVVARDLETPQTALEASDKSKGQSDASESGPPTTAAQEHGAGRAGSGFTVAQMLAELRALRASVIRLWTRQQGQLVDSDLADMTRFNEAIDQAIAESVTQYAEQIAQSKERFLAILGHDLRNPLGAISTSATFMLETGELAEPHLTLVSRIATTSRRMSKMVDDLLDFTQTRFGDSIPITRAEMDVRKMVQDVVTEVASRYPDAKIKAQSHGEIRGLWDCARLTQALTNLVANAVQHGSSQSPITVDARGTPEEAVIEVRNAGPVIPAAELRQIFEPGPHDSSRAKPDDGHLGLGLYIVDKIVSAHKGTIDVRSDADEGTTFTVRLPREA